MAKERTGYTYTDNSGRCYARVTFTNEQGKRRDIKRSAESEKDAKKILKALLRELEDNGENSLDAANMTFAELADHYIDNYLHEAVYVGERKVSGVRGRKEALAEVRPLIAHFGRRKIRSLTYGDIRSYRDLRLQTPTHSDTARHKRELRINPKAEIHSTRSIAAVNKELGKLRRMLNIATREQWLPRNPFNNGESLISVETHRLRILSREEEKRLFAAIETQPRRAHLRGICLIALDCALRRNEIFTLRWSDIDLNRRTLTVRAFNSKTARARTVALTIRAYIELERLWKESGQDISALVFGVSVTVKTAWGKICREAGIKDFHFHDTRATCITRMIEAGMPPAAVMRVSGHSTLRAFYIYVRANEDTVFRAAAALDAFHAQATEVRPTATPELIN
jgi:integrase